MAYDGPYPGGAQRSYGGQPPRGPAPRGGGYGGAPRAPPPHQERQHHNGYDDGYGYNDYEGSYQHPPDRQHSDPGYQQPYPHAAPSRRDHDGPHPQRGGRPGPGPGPGRGRGPGLPSGPAPGPGRHMAAGPPGRGPPGVRRPDPYSAASDPSASRRPPASEPPLSPRGYGYGPEGPYPQNGPRRGPGPDQHMMEQMQSMDLNGDSRYQHRPSMDSQNSRLEFNRPPANYPGRAASAAPQQSTGGPGYPDPRRGPPQNYGHDAFDGYGRRASDTEFLPPSRSMTMPNQDPYQRQMMPPPPQRSETMSYESYESYDSHGSYADGGRAPVPQRPATAAGSRPPPQSYHVEDMRRPESDHYGAGGHDPGYQYQQQDAQGPADGGYDSYYDSEQPPPQRGYQGHHHTHSSAPDFDAIQAQAGRNSFDTAMRPAIEQSQPGAHQTPTLSHAKSQPDLRQPQSAVFEMAGDIPDVPPMPPMAQGYGHNSRSSMDAPSAFSQPPQTHTPAQHVPARAPTAPPGPVGAPGNIPGMGRPGAPAGRNPDTLPSHPTPVRPGLMNNSMVNMNNKPPPVRNYGGVPQQRPGPPPQQPQQQQVQRQPPMQQPQQYQQQQQQQQPAPQQVRQMPEKQAEPAVTPQELEQLRQRVKANPNDQATALRLAKRLIEAADVLVATLPDPKARGRARERYVMDAQKVLKKLCGAQNPDAMFFHADCLGRGLFGGQESDQKEAFTLYQSAAKINHAAAAYRTAVCCEIGHEEGGGTRKDPMKAVQWYKRAATLGDPPAMYKVGMILLKGLLGQPRNPREAVHWLRRAAEQADADNPHAVHELGLLYESAQPNDTIIRDERYALTLFQQAADLGYKFSQFRMGCVYEFGLMGAPIDPRLSIMWYSRAAQQEEHQAELALSGWYLTGSEGVLGQSDTEAYLWARKAAVAGLAKAEYAMGYFTEVGIGITANLEDAKRWYWRAAAQDFPKARDRLEDLKRVKAGAGPRQRERVTRSHIETKQRDGECKVM